MSSSMMAQMMRHMGTGGRIAETEDKAVTVRASSTALLSVDSLDRTQVAGTQTSTNFTINKPNSIFNGFFNRIAMNEIVLDWCVPNISDEYDPANNVFGVTMNPGPGAFSVTIPSGHYTVEEVLDYVIAGLNALAGAGSFRLEDANGNAWTSGPVYLGSTIGTFDVDPTELAKQLSLDTVITAQNSYSILCPKLLPIYYIDFVSPQLTYNQDLKDNTTSQIVRDVLYRWVLAYDNVPIPTDAYGFPIYQGYRAFISRRYLNYPKQILWNPTQPVGQLSFQIYSSYGELLDLTNLGNLEYQMSLLFSEN